MRLSLICLAEEGHMSQLSFGRKKFTFSEGVSTLTCMSITEKPLPLEDEAAFTARLLTKYANCQGDMEIIFKHGKPDYAIITIE